MNGQFVISLDFEKFWGVFDSLSSEGYQKNISNVDTVIDRLLDLSNKYNIRLTFSTVGFLFNKNKEEYLKNIPKSLPTYSDIKHNPYPLLDHIGNNQEDDNIHYAYKTLLKIKNEAKHEIGTHSYCHYYCLEKGQTTEQFEADLKMAKQVAKNIDVDIKSIVFPRNQVNDDYLKICKEQGILSYRGVENHTIYKAKSKKETKKPTYRIMRLSDSYINLTGSHTFKFDDLNNNGMINIPSSRFLRPYNHKLRILEPLKINRVKKGMNKAAKKGELYHLWWHPHNFGNYIDENFNHLEQLFKHFKYLNEKRNFESVTMTELALKLNNQQAI